MKRLGMVIMIVVLLVTLSAGAASAAWWISIDCLDPVGDPPTGTQFQITWNDDCTPACFSTYQYTLFMDFDTPGATLNSFYTPPGFMDMGSGVVGSEVRLTCLGFGATTIPNGTVLGDVTLTGGTGNMNFDYTNHITTFLVGDGGTGTDIMGPALDSGGNLVPASEGPSPAPPIPEIITIVLISIGVIALGGYVWYRRRNQQAALAA